MPFILYTLVYKGYSPYEIYLLKTNTISLYISISQSFDFMEVKE